MDGGWGSIVRSRRAIGVAGQSEGHAEGSVAEARETTGTVAGQSVQNRCVGIQGKRSSGRDDVLVSCDEDSSGFVVQTSYCQGKRHIFKYLCIYFLFFFFNSIYYI